MKLPRIKSRKIKHTMTYDTDLSKYTVVVGELKPENIVFGEQAIISQLSYASRFSAKQKALLYDMLTGWSLESWRTIGDGTHFTLHQKSGDSKFADKRTVNSLMKRKVIVLDKHTGYAFTGRSYWKLNTEKK